MEMALPEAEGAVSMRMEQVEFVENGDGTVSVVLPETLPIALAASDDEAQQVTMTLEMTHEALEMVVSGTAEAMEYTYDADAVTMALTDLQAGEETPEIRAAQIRMEDLSGTSQTALGETTRAVQQNMSAGPVTYDLDFTDPGEGGTLVFSGSLARATFAGAGTIPETFDSNDIAAALRDGFRFDSRMDYETGSTVYRFEDAGDVLEGANSSDSGTLTTAIGPGWPALWRRGRGRDDGDQRQRHAVPGQPGHGADGVRYRAAGDRERDHAGLRAGDGTGRVHHARSAVVAVRSRRAIAARSGDAAD